MKTWCGRDPLAFQCAPKVSGHFEGGGEHVRVWEDGVRWWLGGGWPNQGDPGGLIGGSGSCTEKATDAY